MRIAFYGNTCNNFLAVARAVRRASAIDAHLFIDDDAEWNQLPESEDPSLIGGYPDWIHKGPYRRGVARLWPGASPLIPLLASFDIVMVSGHGVRLAPFVAKPFVLYATGWDVTVAPFPIRFFRRPKGAARRLAALVGGVWQRRGIRAVREIWSQPFAPFSKALARLDVPKAKIVPQYFPIMIDTDLFSHDPAARSSGDRDVRRLVDDHDFIVFHPSRMMMDASPRFVETGQWKGNDRLLDGFAQFVREHPSARPALVLIDRPTSPDTERARAMIATLGIEKRVVWLKSETGYGFDRHQLVRFYSIADVVVDEFGIGWFGSIVVEGLACARPVMCYVDEDVMRGLYPWHPIVSPRTSAEIATALGQLYLDPSARRALGERGRAWVEEFHSFDGAAGRYVQQIAGLRATP